MYPVIELGLRLRLAKILVSNILRLDMDRFLCDFKGIKTRVKFLKKENISKDHQFELAQFLRIRIF